MNGIKKLSHYTETTESLIDICNGNFRTTDINDFGDKLEGKLILHRINKILSSLNVLNIIVRLKNGFKIVLIGFRVYKSTKSGYIGHFWLNIKHSFVIWFVIWLELVQIQVLPSYQVQRLTFV